MSRCCGLAVACLFLASSLFADDQSLWREYGLVHKNEVKNGKLSVTSYQMKDLTGAVAAWQWLRSSPSKSCTLAPFCAVSGNRTVVSDDNYVVVFDGAPVTKAVVDPVLNALPNRQKTSLPAILSFMPEQGLVSGSARYVLGPASLQEFAPELAGSQPGFEEGAEAQIAKYRIGPEHALVHLALFYYASPEMARMHAAQFEKLSGAHVKRSDVLVAVVYGNATPQQADSLLSRVQYEAHITWNDTPPPSPIKPMLQLLISILYLSILLCALGLAAGLMYAGMRIWRRRYGTLEADEAMTTLHLSGT